MKKRIINIAISFGVIIFSLIINGITLYAHQDNAIDNIVQEDNNNNYEIRKTKVPVEETMLISDKLDANNNIINEGESVKRYLSKKHPTVNSNDWVRKESNSTITTTGNIPIEMQGNDFPKSIILQALEELRNEEHTMNSKYGGCGPIATMGIVEYFAKTFSYYNIAHTSEKDKVAIAKSILVNTITYEFFGSTFTHPYDCAVGFNETMRKYRLENTIIATDQGMKVSKSQKIAKVKEQIDKGLPVSMYALGATDNGNAQESIDNHYVNIYGYQEWEGYDVNGNHFTNTIFVVRPNWNYENLVVYVDSSILSASWTGIIYYDIRFNKKQLTSHSFNSFVNDNNQGQYFNDEKEQEINISEDFSFNTKRLRCSFIENEYLVLSTIKKNGVYAENERETAYLEFQFSEPIMKIEYDIALWSGKEKITNDTIGEFQYFSNSKNKWITIESYNMMILPIKDYPKHINHYLSLKEAAYKIRFIACHPKVDADRNKGRIVLDNINLYFDNHNQSPHIHRYNEHYASNGLETHTAYCSCGESTLQNHTLIEEDGMVKCQYCDYEHTHQYSCEQYNDMQHKMLCICGDFYLENHNMPEITQPHTTISCSECGKTQDIGHVYNHHYCDEGKDGHNAFCSCGEWNFEEHNHNIGYSCSEGDDFHGIYCICGHPQYVKHSYTNAYEYLDENHHKSYCECTDYRIEEHVYDEDGSCIYCNS